jgi:2-polyprenyl-3-methyl-5-hydroxy-6-metoxy-1,4-benzoquinol methylase
MTAAPAMPSASTSCPICGSTALSLLSKHVNKDVEYSLRHCAGCQLEFFDPLWSKPEYYSENYKEHKFEFGYVPPWIHKQFLDESLPAGIRMLDVGCGGGELLNAARKKGYTVSGVDVNTVALARARRQYGLDVSDDTLAALRAKNLAYDVVTLFEVVEHLTDPLSFLRDLRGVLADGGRVFLSTPSRERTKFFDDSWDFPPHHFTRWNEASLRFALEAAGFRIVGMRQQEFNLRHLIGHFYYPLQNRLGQRHVSALAAAAVAGALFLPMRLAGARGRWFYVTAEKA